MLADFFSPQRHSGTEIFSMPLLLCGIILFHGVHAQSQQFALNSDSTIHWQFRKAGDTTWHDATVPGCVHTDLQANQLIPDPFYGDNEKKVQWVENEDWEYQTFFDCPSTIFESSCGELHFDGLDTYAAVYLNDSLILHADNMFREWNVDVKKFLLKKNNHLLIHFYSAVKKGNELASQLGYKLPGDDGGKALMRKAQYQFGWDWAPRLVTCGVWKDVKLVSAGENEKQQPQHTLSSQKIRLVQQPDSAGSSFYFEMNGQPLFVKGANLVPPDHFLSRVSDQDYKRLVDDAVAAHMNMLRVWGGGAYLPDAFYDYCDEKGILIWQDFMFANAMVPGDSMYVENVKQEAIDQVIRLRHHPCIAVWCGNNEISEAWNNWGFRNDNMLKAGVNDKIWNDYLRIFDSILPQVVHAYDSGRAYIESSPKFGRAHQESYELGDSHYWGVWWDGEPFAAYETHIGRFMSEYGFQSFPSMDGMYAFATEDEWKRIPFNKKSAGPVMNVHQKHPRGYELIHEYMQQDYRVPKNVEQYAYVSQLLQRDGIATAIEAHRRAKPYCMGTMYWQLNDCWPVISWSSMDHTGQWKALHHALARDLYKTFLISIHQEKDDIGVWVVSDSTKDVNATLKMEWLSFDGTNRTTWLDSTITVSAGKSKKTASFRLEKKTKRNSHNSFLHAELMHGELVLAEKNFFFEKPKSLALPDPHIASEIHYSGIQSPYADYPATYSISILSDKFAKDVLLSYDFEEVKFSDNYFDLLPGEKKTVLMFCRQAIDEKNLPLRVLSLFNAE
jgi:beta-mannosidase